MNILATGLTGLVGSRISELLNGRHTFENISTSTGVNILDKEKLLAVFKNSSADIVLHLAAKTHVDGCEMDKEEDEKILLLPQDEQEQIFLTKQTAWAINVIGTKNVIEAAEKTNKKLIYISTDFIFDGEIEENTFYGEEEKGNPVNWYARTKFEGETLVKEAQIPWVIMRIAYPYRAVFTKNDFVRVVLSLLDQGKQLQMVTDHIMMPTFIDDIANAFDTLITQNKTGIYHVVGSQAISPFEAGKLIAKHFDIKNAQITSTTREKYFVNKAIRPFRLQLKNDKIQQLGVTMRTFEGGLEEVKKQRENQ